MGIWMALIVVATTIINFWVLKWVDLERRMPDMKTTNTKSSVYIRKTGIVIVALLLSVSTLAYLMFSNLPITKVTALLISLNVSAILMGLLAWIFMLNNNRIQQLLTGYDLFMH